MSTKMAHKVTVDVPVKDAYAMWTQFERLPTFMKAVDKVEELDRRHLRWHVDVGGKKLSFDTEIIEQVPDRRIAWRSSGGTKHEGAVDFTGLADDVTEIEVSLDVDMDKAPAPPALVREQLDSTIAGDLRRFKQRVERDGATGGQGSARRLTAVDRAAGALVLVGALNWGIVAVRGRDVVAGNDSSPAGGPRGVVSRVVYGVVGAAGVVCAVRLGRLGVTGRAAAPLSRP